MEVFKNIYKYRELLKANVKKEIRGKYKGSFLGIMWSFVNPLLMVLVYAIVFPYIMRVQQENYLIFLIAAIIPWTFFTTVINQGTTTILNNANLVKKVYFPREILPISVVVSGLINFFISCLIILLFVILGGVGISWHILFLPFVALVQCVLSLAIIFVLSAIEIYVKDVEYIVNFILQMLFYVTPILYSADILPSNIGIILNINPMTHLINAYRDIFLYHIVPGVRGLFYIFLISLVLLVIGYKIFKKLEKGFAEEV